MNFNITPEAREIYKASQRETPTPREEAPAPSKGSNSSLYLRKSTINGQSVYKVGTATTWDKIIQTATSIFSFKDSYSYGENAIKEIKEVSSLEMEILSPSSSIPRTSFYEPSLENNKYLRVTIKNGKLDYKVGASDSLWKSIKHFCRGVFGSAKYFYGDDVDKEINKISANNKSDTAEECPPEANDEEISRGFFIRELEFLAPDGEDFKQLLKELESESNQYRNLLGKKLRIFKDTCDTIAKENLLNNDEKKTLDKAIKGLSQLLDKIKTDLPAAPAPANTVGVPNIGNSCYMNSAMQALIATPAFREALNSLDLNSLTNERERAVRQQAAQFIQAYETGETSKSLSGHAKELRQALFNAEVIGHSPEDQIPPAALDGLIAKIEESPKPEEKRELAVRLELLLAREPLTNQNDAIVVIDALVKIVGLSLSTVETKTADAQGLSPIESKISVNSLPIPLVKNEEKTYDLKTLIEKNFASRINTAPPKFKSFDGLHEVQVKKCEEQLKIEGAPPPCICLQLNRLVLERQSNGRFMQTCIRDNVELNPDQKFDLTDYFAQKPETPASYKITAAVRQTGDEKSGHYTATVREKNGWKLCDDSTVKNLTPGEAKAEMCASNIYILELSKD